MNYFLQYKSSAGSLLALVVTATVASCGTYQQASYYDNDGIYSDEVAATRTEQYPQRRPGVTPRQAPEESNAYSDYFGQKADEYGEILDSEIFTDVDSYSGTAQDSLAQDGDADYYYDPNNTYNGYAGWGDNATELTINVYDSNWGWNNWGWSAFGWGYPYYSRPGFWGWNNWGWNSWAWGGWGSPWGWNSWAWNGYWGYPAYWGGFYANPYYGYSYYGYPYYRYNRGYGYGTYAYNRSRRGVYNNSLASNSLRGRSNLTARTESDNSRYRCSSGRSNTDARTSTGRSSTQYRNSTARRSVNVDALERNRAYRSSRSTRAVPRYDSQGRSSGYSSGNSRSTYSRGNSAARSSGSRSTYSRTSPSGNSTYSRPASPNRSSGYRSSGSSAPSRSTYRSSGSSSRSSGSMRSSSPPSRSSGGRSSGGGRRSH